MELTSFYENVFYSSSLGERTGCEEEKYCSVSEDLTYQHYSPLPSYPAYCYSPSSLSPESSSVSSVSPASELPCQPSSEYRHSRSSKLPKIPPLEVLQQRRLAANARERKRANKINFAFNRLRRVLPGFNDREISKFEAIQLARNYIAQLTAVLQTDQEEPLTAVLQTDQSRDHK